MFGKLKDKMAEKMLEKQLAGMPEEQKQMIMKMIQENPDFFKKIGEEIQQAVKGGKSQMSASMEVMRKYQGEMQKLMKK